MLMVLRWKKRDKSNHIALLIMNVTISSDIARVLLKKDTTEEFFPEMEEQFKGSGKVYAHELLANLLLAMLDNIY